MKILIIQTKVPYANWRAESALNFIMASSAFAEQVSVLFSDDSIWQLVTAQHAEQINHTALDKSLAALPYYEVKHCYVEQATAHHYGLTERDFYLPIAMLDHTATQQLITEHDLIYHF